MVSASYLYAELERLNTSSIWPGIRITTGDFTYFSKMSLNWVFSKTEDINHLFLFSEAINAAYVKMFLTSCRMLAD